MTGKRGPVVDSLLLAVSWHGWKVQQHREPGRALNKRPDRGTLQSEDQVAFPVSWHCPVVCLGRTLADHDLGTDELLAPPLGAGSGDSQRSPGSGLSNRLCEGVGSWVFSGLGLVGWGSGFRVGLGLFSSRGCRCRGFLLVCWLCFGRRAAAALERIGPWGNVPWFW